MKPAAEFPVSLQATLSLAIAREASDVHFSAGQPVFLRIAGELLPIAELDSAHEDSPLSDQQIDQLTQIVLDDVQQQQLQQRGSADGAFSFREVRFRFNAFHRSGRVCFAIRRLASDIPTLDQLGIDKRLYQDCELTDGLILVAGPTGSGKSTTIASLLDRINQTRRCHIITIEDPVEFLHPSKQSLVNQRQIGSDVADFHQALLDAMRQDPDVILVGELRDLATIRTAIAAAETGHLVFATVHAGDTKSAVERLVSAYSPEEQHLAQRLVAAVLRTVVVQHLLPLQSRPDSKTSESERKRVLASERVRINAAIANLIASGNLSQLTSSLQSSGESGVWTLDESLAKLLRHGMISEKTARSLARQPDMLGALTRGR